MEKRTQSVLPRKDIDRITASRVAITCKRYHQLAVRLRTLLNQARSVHHRDGFCILPVK